MTPKMLAQMEEQMKDLRVLMIRTAAEAFRPQLLLVDYAPTGVWGELLPTLEALKALGYVR